MTALVIGAAVSGRAAARLLHADGEKVVVYDRDQAALGGVDADEAHLALAVLAQRAQQPCRPRSAGGRDEDGGHRSSSPSASR